MDHLYDIFISYPAPLNRSPYPGWVARFRDALREALHGDLRRTAGLTRDLNIYFDQAAVEANSAEEDMLEAARHSRLFLAIVSPDYQTREWAPRELDAFPAQAVAERRLFIIATKPLPKNEVTLAALKSPFFKPFFARSPLAQDHPLPFHPDSQQFQDAVYGVALSMAKKLGELNGVTAPSVMGRAPPPVARESARAGGRTILLAHVSDDLDRDGKSEFRSVASELVQYCSRFDVRLLSGADYPLGGEAFKEAFEKDLLQADLVVQLLGETLGKRPRDLPEGYVLHQARRATAQTGVKLMQWRRSDIEVDAIEDRELRALLQGEAVTAATLASFKNDLVAWIETPPKPPKGESLGSTIDIFIDANDIDFDAATRCKEALEPFFSVIMTRPEGDPEKASIREYLESLIVDSNLIVFLNGAAEEAWVGKQMLAAQKVLRGKYGRGLAGARCDGPPPGKRAFHGTIRGVAPVDCRTDDGLDWQFEALSRHLRKDPA